jgi:hypothetical protein
LDHQALQMYQQCIPSFCQHSVVSYCTFHPQVFPRVRSMVTVKVSWLHPCSPFIPVGKQIHSTHATVPLTLGLPMCVHMYTFCKMRDCYCNNELKCDINITMILFIRLMSNRKRDIRLLFWWRFHFIN